MSLLPEGEASQGRFQLLRRSLGEDLRTGVRNGLVNWLAAGWMVPRAVRYLLYRMGGVDTRTANIFPGCVMVGRHVSIGADTFLNRQVFLEGVGPLRIGARCLFGMQAMVLTSTHPPVEDAPFSRTSVGITTTIGNDCWIGARAVILPGVTVGDGCIIGAAAVVTRDCAPGGLYVGSPARRVRTVAPEVARNTILQRRAEAS
jgi:maltose O-acetyltransferase